jgi:hypothetical protein
VSSPEAPPPPRPPPPTAPASPVRGLTEEQAGLSAQDFFARFPFEPRPPDPEQLSAQEFLSFVR